MGGVAIAAVRMKERHVVAAFKSAGATSAERARTPEEIDVAMHGAAWRFLHNNAIVRDAGDGRFYLDVLSWEASVRARRRRALMLVVLGLAFALWWALAKH